MIVLLDWARHITQYSKLIDACSH